MHRGLAVEAAPGVLSGHPGEAIDALADLAEADGADREVWLQKALAHAGASKASVVVRGEPRYRVLEDATIRAHVLFDAVVRHAIDEIVALLQGRAADLPADPRPPGT